MDVSSVLTLISCSMSVAGSTVLIASFFVFPKWVTVQREAKSVLFVMCLLDGLTAINYFNVVRDNTDPSMCVLTATWMQCFEIGSWLYEMFFAIELTVIVRDILRYNQCDLPSRKAQQAKRRQLFYLIFTVTYGLVSCTVMYIQRDYGEDDDSSEWCWIKNPFDRIYYGYIALWVSVLVTLVANYNTFLTVVKARQIIREISTTTPSLRKSFAGPQKRSSFYSNLSYSMLHYALSSLLLFSFFCYWSEYFIYTLVQKTDPNQIYHLLRYIRIGNYSYFF